jgi:hypothetical protein
MTRHSTYGAFLVVKLYRAKPRQEGVRTVYLHSRLGDRLTGWLASKVTHENDAHGTLHSRTGPKKKGGDSDGASERDGGPRRGEKRGGRGE